MKTIKLNTNEVLICDPCYIKKVSYDGKLRFDALKRVKTLHEGDDGIFPIYGCGKYLKSLGVDSGRIWAMRAEFTCEVRIDAGLSGYLIIINIPDKDLSKLQCVNEREDEDEEA